jgi:hypothetical protein
MSQSDRLGALVTEPLKADLNHQCRECSIGAAQSGSGFASDVLRGNHVYPGTPTDGRVQGTILGNYQLADPLRRLDTHRQPAKSCPGYSVTRGLGQYGRTSARVSVAVRVHSNRPAAALRATVGANGIINTRSWWARRGYRVGCPRLKRRRTHEWVRRSPGNKAIPRPAPSAPGFR